MEKDKKQVGADHAVAVQQRLSPRNKKQEKTKQKTKQNKEGHLEKTKRVTSKKIKSNQNKCDMSTKQTMTKNLRGEEEEEGEQYTEKDVHIPKEATKDESLAKALIGTPIIRHFKADDVAVGKVVGYYVFGEEDPKILQGYIVHTIKYEAEDLIETHAQDDYTLQQVLKQHRLFNEKEGDIPGPINFKMPEAGTTRNEIAVKKIKTYGPQILKTMMIPTSLKKYNVILYRNNKTIRAQVTERMINSVGNEIWKLKPTNTTEQLEEWVDTAQLLKYIKNAKSVGNQSFPNKRLPEMTAMKNYMPDTSEGWSFEQIGLVGRHAAIRLSNCPQKSKKEW